MMMATLGHRGDIQEMNFFLFMGPRDRRAGPHGRNIGVVKKYRKTEKEV